MKHLITSLLFAGISGAASAHTLPGDEEISIQLGHQLLGAHHFPVFLALVVMGLLGLLYLKRGRSR
jgi:hypothetical protein